MPSENNIKWEGILSEYQLKDPLNLSERPDGSSVSISFAGKHASEFLFATVQNGKLNGSALIKDRLQRRVLNFVFVNNSISGPYELYKMVLLSQKVRLLTHEEMEKFGSIYMESCCFMDSMIMIEEMERGRNMMKLGFQYTKEFIKRAFEL